MNNKAKKLSSFISDNIEEIKKAFIKNDISITDSVIMTQDSDGTITAWPAEFVRDLWFDEGMWFAETAKDTERSKTVLYHDVVFKDHISHITCIYIGVGCIEYDDDITETTSYQQIKTH